MNVMQRGAAWLADQLGRHAAQSATYYRGTTAIAVVPAVVAKQTYEVVDVETGVITNVIAFDFTVRRKLLATRDGTPIEPREGDRLKITLNAEIQTYEVLPLGDRPCVEKADTSGVMLLIHTKET